MKQIVILSSSILLFLNAVSSEMPKANIKEKGASVQYKSADMIGNYAFGYAESHSSGGSYRREMGDIYGNKYGSYGLKDIDGRMRVLRYIADSNGFKVNLQTNEPGFEAHGPADVSLNFGAKNPAAAYSTDVNEVVKSASNIDKGPQHLLSFGASPLEMLQP